MNRLEEIGIGLDALVIFKNLRNDKVISALIKLLVKFRNKISVRLYFFRNFCIRIFE